MTAIPTSASTGGIGLTLRDVRRAFLGGVVAVDGISLDVAPGEFVAILGPSGCGKSTLLRAIAGLDRPTSGLLQLLDPNAKEKGDGGRALAYVFQDAHLLPWRNVLRNVAMPLELMGVAANERADAARNALEQVGLGDAMRRYPAQLSGGMRMRVSLARAMVTRPRLLLLDEPFAALDELTRQRLDEMLRGLWDRAGMTVLFVTHSIAEAAFLADRAVVMTRRPGRVVIDHRLTLGRERSGATRTSEVYVREMRVLYEALERGDRGEPA
ncbi:MAG: ABC transporter ATP-binding protein [Planctomycetes bacterium]|nr:ABC transporter ATP-binding protein [Planctomycetota bacterium]